MTVLYLPLIDSSPDEEETTLTYEIIQHIFMTRANEMEFHNDMDSQKKIC